MIRQFMTGLFMLFVLGGTVAFAQEANVDSVTVSPTTATIAVGDTLDLTATAFDSEGNEVTAEITWSLTGEIGTLDNGQFIATAAGTGSITAAVDSITATADITVEEPVVEPVLASIVIAPDSAEVTVGDTLSFTATAYDTEGNEMAADIAWTVTGEIGTVDAGEFVATTAGSGTVVASVDTISASAAVTVAEPAAPVAASISIDPATATATVGDTLVFTATVLDTEGSAMDVDVAWAIDNAVGTIDSSGTLVTDAAGSATITASYDTLSATASVTVEALPPVLASIVIAPDSAEVTVGDTLSFTATAYDTDGNEMAADIAWTVTGEIGTVDAGEFVATTAGSGTVVASVDTISASAAVTVAEPVVEPVLASIVIEPDSAVVTVGDSLSLVATAYDTDGNEMTADITWTVTGEIGTIDAGTFVATTAGEGTVMAAVDTISAVAVLVVDALPTPVAAEIEISPVDPEVAVGDTVQFTAVVYDADGNELSAEVIWGVEGTNGSIDADGLFIAQTAGEAVVSGTVDDISDSSTVTITEEPQVEDGYTITAKRQFPDGSIKNLGSPITVGDTLVVGGIPHPFNYLNSTRIYFPEGSISSDITLMIKIPEFAHVKGNDVEFDGDILTAVTFDVMVDGEVVHPFYFDVPVEVSLPYKYGLLRKMDIDPATLGMYYVGQNGQLYREGIEEAAQDEGIEGITAKVAHFSDLALAPTDASVSVKEDAIPTGFALERNFPNPFNPETTIPYSLSAESSVRVDIYNLLGQHVRSLVSGVQPAGNHSVVWNGTDDRGNQVTSGIYIYRLEAGTHVQSHKLMLMK